QTVPDNTGPVVGVDLGVKTLATLSDGTVIPNPRPLKRRLKQVKRLHKIEDLHVAGMLKNDHLAQAIADVGFAEFRRQLTYKAAWYGSRVVVVSRWEPTSKRCSACGWLDADLTLADRVFCCEACGLTVDRNLNAAINLARLAASSADTENACGGERAGLSCERQVKRSPAKQEPNTLTSRVD
ncbi:MAG TPA: transposase, partial [Ktedonobacterales bacterium]|nr:transposase [Ktedonobacterales bacterium]